MNETTSPAGTDRPGSLAELIAALSGLSGLPPVERARRIPGLIEACKAVLARERGAAMDEATGAGGLSKAALAEELGISRSKVYDAIALSRGSSPS